MSGVQPGGFVDGSGIDNVELLLQAGVLTLVEEVKKPSKADKAGDK